MHTVTFSEDINTNHPSQSRRNIQAQHGAGRISKPQTPRNGYLPQHRARDTYMRERSLSEPHHVKLKNNHVPNKAHGHVPGLRPEVQNLWINQSNNVQHRHYQRRLLYGINEEGTTEELQEQDNHLSPRGFSASYDAVGMLAGPLSSEVDEEEDWGSLFVKNSIQDGEATFVVSAILPDGRHVSVSNNCKVFD